MTTAPFRAVADTHVGRKRKANQDWCAIEPIQHPNGMYHLLILADGMGGGVKGDVASHTAVNAVVDYFRTTGWYNPEEASREAAFSANRAVFDLGTGGGQATKSFMGTTLVFALVEEVTNRAWITNVGDSRAYLLRHGLLEQVTRDHSVLGDFATEGVPLTPEELARLRNVVTRAVGLEPTVEPDIFGPIELEATDRLLLSSDGLHGVVTDDRIQRFMASQTMEPAVKSLIKSANVAGGPDNITVVMGGRETGFPRGAGGKGQLQTIVLAGATAVLAIIVVVAAVYALRETNSPGVDREQMERAAPTPVDSPTSVSGGQANVTPNTPTLFVEITAPANFNCAAEFLKLMQVSGRNLTEGEDRVVRNAFYLVIDASAPEGRKCPNGLWEKDRLRVPNLKWFESATRPLPRGMQ